MSEEFDLEDIKFYMQMSTAEKLEYLERTLLSLERITPLESKELQLKLKSEGF